MATIFNIDRNAKTIKGRKRGYWTAVLYLAPAKLSGYEVCPMSTTGCRASCLNTAGRGVFTTTQQSRIRKTKMFFENRAAFMLTLEKDLERFINHTKTVARRRHRKITPCVRLNGTSDIPWENISFVGANGMKYSNLMERFPDVQFYDYTKRHNRTNLPSNYTLTFSLAENNEDKAIIALKNGINVATVFRKNLPKTYLRRKVVNGDETDLRFLDPKKVIIGLKAKGRARKDNSGFVKDVKVRLPLLT